MQVDNFDDLFTGNPVDIEKNLSLLLPEAEKRSDKSVYLQIFSQIALAQAMQQKFELAHRTLDKAEQLVEPQYQLAKIRLLLERGRVYHQSDNLVEALSFFMQSYELAKSKTEFDFHTVNAAHMIAIVENNVNDKIKWNLLAIRLAEKTQDERCHTWLGPINNNLAQNYLEAERYAAALKLFEKCKNYAEARGDQLVIRGAAWGIGRCMRGLCEYNNALEVQKDLLEQYEKIIREGSLAIELIYISRGLVHEELAEIYLEKKLFELSKKHARLAYNDLLKDPWMNKLYPERIQRMYELGQSV